MKAHQWVIKTRAGNTLLRANERSCMTGLPVGAQYGIIIESTYYKIGPKASDKRKGLVTFRDYHSEYSRRDLEADNATRRARYARQRASELR